jgi:hypothetical protein
LAGAPFVSREITGGSCAVLQKKSGRDRSQPDSQTARGVHPTALPSWLYIVTAIGPVKPPQGHQSGTSTQASASLNVRETGPVGTSLDFIRASPALERFNLICVAIEWMRRAPIYDHLPFTGRANRPVTSAKPDTVPRKVVIRRDRHQKRSILTSESQKIGSGWVCITHESIRRYRFRLTL